MKHDGYTSGFSLRRWLVAAALGCLWLIGAHAQSVTTITGPYNGYVVTQSGATTSIGPVMTNSTPFTFSPPPGTATVNTAGGFAAGADAAGNPKWSTSFKAPMGASGRAAAMEATEAVGKRTAAKAMAKWAFRAVPLVGTAITGYEIYTLMRDLNFDAQNGAVVKKDPNACAVSPCYVWSASGQDQSTWANSPYAAFDLWIPSYQKQMDWSGHHFSNGGCTQDSATHAYCWAHDDTNGNQNGPFSVGTVATRQPDQNPYLPTTQQDLEDAIASQSGWPSHATAAQAEAARNGETARESGAVPSVSGPASVPGESSTKTETGTDPTNGKQGTKTTTTNNTYNNTYNNNTYNTTVTTTTTSTWNYSDGTTKTDTEQEQKEPEDPCQKDPNAVSCAKFDTPEGEIPKQTKDLTYTAENVSVGSSACPANVVATIRGKSVTIYSYASTCDTLANKVKPLVLAICALIAYFILMPGGKEATA